MPEETWEIDKNALDNLTAKEWDDYMQAVLFKDMVPVFSKVVKKMPYAGDPAQAETYAALKTKEVQEVLKKVTACFYGKA